MAKDLIANPPSFELATRMAHDVPAPKRIPVTPLLRTAISAVLNDKAKYEEFVRYFKKGEITGSTQADLYLVAELLVNWEAAAGRTQLCEMLHGSDKQIRLVDIVKRLSPELRRVKFDVQRGVIVGTLIGKVATASTDQAA